MPLVAPNTAEYAKIEATVPLSAMLATAESKCQGADMP